MASVASSDTANQFSVRSIATMVVLFIALLSCPLVQADNQPAAQSKHPVIRQRKTVSVPIGAAFVSQTDITADEVSTEAQSLAEQLDLITRLKHLEELRQKLKSYSAEKPSQDLRDEYRDLKDEYRDLKEELLEVIEQTRLEIDYVRAEICAETALQNELIRSYTQERDERVLRTNLWSFRANGPLWAVCEALSIPTYAHPRLSIPSGTIGILAGIVPTALSIAAVRQGKSAHFERQPRVNMLAKIFDYPIEPRVDYPSSVWNYLHAKPAGLPADKNRIDTLIDEWIQDSNIRILTDLNNRKQLDVLTGITKQNLTVELLSDRVSMLNELEALIARMNRPLLELMLAVRGVKHLPTAM
jgi:hypothetical protein